MSAPRPRFDPRRSIICLLVLGLSLLAHVGGLSNDFVLWDDPTHVTQNPLIRSLAPSQIGAMFTTFAAKLYLPLTWLSLAIDYRLWGQSPFGYHLTNILLHLASSGLVLFLVERVVRARGAAEERLVLPIAAIAAVLFGVHPLRVESVAWVTERKDVLFALFYLLALHFYLRFIQGVRPRRAWWAAWMCFVLSALSKSAAVTLPLVAWLMDGWLTRRWRWRPLGPFLLVSLVIGVLTIIAQGSGAGDTIAGTERIPLTARLGLVGYCALFYVRKTVWPFELSAVYPTFDEMDWNGVLGAAWLLGWLGLTAFLGWGRRRQPLLWGGWCFYLVTLSPTIGMLPVGIHVVADRYCYVPFLGLAVMVGSLVSQAIAALFRRSRSSGWLVSVVGAVAVLGLTQLSAERTRVWRDTESLFQDVLETNPDHWLAHLKLTAQYRRTGRLDDALHHARRAVELEPAATLSQTSLAYVLIDRGTPREALDHLRPLVEGGTTDPRIWQALGEVFLALEDGPNARAALTRAASLPRANHQAIDSLLSRIPATDRPAAD